MTAENRARIARELRVRVSDVESMEARLAGGDQSLNVGVSEGSSDSWQDFLVDESPDPEEVVADMRDSRTRSRWLRRALAELTPRERKIIGERRLGEDTVTLRDLGVELGISKERVRQIEQRALQKLKKSISRQMSKGKQSAALATPWD